MKTVCNGCEFLIIDEEEQDLIKNQNGVIYPHYCKKYQRIVRHFPYDEPYIYPCNECLDNHLIEEGDVQE